MPELRPSKCPSCGGELELPSAGVIRCLFCGSRLLMWHGEFRSIACRRLPRCVTDEAAREAVEKRLTYEGFQKLPTLRSEVRTGRWLMRQGRVRTRPLDRKGGSHLETYREGLFGVPTPEATPGPLVHVADPAVLEESPLPPPEELAREMEHLEFRLARAIEEDVKAGRLAEPVVEASWGEDIYAVEVPVIDFVFEVSPKDGLIRGWRDKRPDSRYTVSIDLHSGRYLRWEAPVFGLKAAVLIAMFLVPVLSLVGLVMAIPVGIVSLMVLLEASGL